VLCLSVAEPVAEADQRALQTQQLVCWTRFWSCCRPHSRYPHQHPCKRERCSSSRAVDTLEPTPSQLDG
jgi:hypothetical protein